MFFYSVHSSFIGQVLTNVNHLNTLCFIFKYASFRRYEGHCSALRCNSSRERFDAFLILRFVQQFSKSVCWFNPSLTWLQRADWRLICCLRVKWGKVPEQSQEEEEADGKVWKGRNTAAGYDKKHRSWKRLLAGSSRQLLLNPAALLSPPTAAFTVPWINRCAVSRTFRVHSGQQIKLCVISNTSNVCDT